MNAISPVIPGSSAVSGISAKDSAKVDYDAFLTLLVAEMKNQDPTKPMESTDFIAQLATFSNVEQAVQTNEKLDALLTASALAHADVIGKTLETADGKGMVASVRMAGGAVEAILEDGRAVSLAGGWVVS